MRTSYFRECEELTVKIARHLSECTYFSAVELHSACLRMETLFTSP